MTTADILIEALPYLQEFHGKLMVIKLGGSIMDDTALLRLVIQDIVLMKQVGMQPVVVHGGGKHISLLMKRLGKEAVFVNGLRVTDKDTMELTQMVLAGLINKDIVSSIGREGGKAVGISGKDGGLMQAKKMSKDDVDYGHVGEITSIDASIIHTLLNNSFIPVISPIAADTNGDSLNINADTAAQSIAESLTAQKLIFITDVTGVLQDVSKPETLLSIIRKSDIDVLITNGTITAGMIPKLRSAALALDRGIGSIHIISGRISHSLLLELFTKQGIGTQIR